jgi:sugar lactone lactonase YvrE
MNFNFPCHRGHSDSRRPEVPAKLSERFTSSLSSELALWARGEENTTSHADHGSFAEPSLWRTVDDSGNLFLTDNNLIRKIDPLGNPSIVAGSGDPGFADGLGKRAAFAYPAGVAVDRRGNLFVADTGNHRIRKIDPDGQVTTLAGNGQPGYADGIGTAAQFHFPLGVTIDEEGNVYVADRSNRRIRKIDANATVSTFAGSGISGLVDGPGATAQFTSPAGILVDKTGSIYVSDLRSPNVRKIDRNGFVSTLGTPSVPAANTAGAIAGRASEGLCDT